MSAHTCKNCGGKVSDPRRELCRSCAASQRWENYRQAKSTESSLPLEIRETIVEDFGKSESLEVSRALERILAAPSVNSAPNTERTYGNYQGDIYGLIPNKYTSYSGKLSFEKIDNMLRCGQVLFALAIKKAPISTLFKNKMSIIVKEEGEDYEEGENEFLDTVNINLKEVLQRSINDILTCMDYGVSINEVVWKVEKNYALIDKLNSVDPKTVDKIYIDSKGRFDGFSQVPPNMLSGVTASIDTIRVPVEQSLLITYNKKFRNLWGDSILTPVYPFYFWYDLVWRSFVRYLEKCGTPPVIATAPSNYRVKTKTGAFLEAIDVAEQLAYKVSRSPAVAIPSDTNADGRPLWSMAYMNSDSKGDQFVQALELLGKMIIRSILVADTVGTQLDSGSYNLGSIHMAVTMLDNERILSEILQQINKYLLPKYVEYKYGQSSDIKLYIETIGLNEAEKAKYFEILRSGMNSKASALDQIDYEDIGKSIGVPFLTREEMMEQKKENMKMMQELGPNQPSQFGNNQPSSEEKGEEESSEGSKKEEVPESKEVENSRISGIILSKDQLKQLNIQ